MDNTLQLSNIHFSYGKEETLKGLSLSMPAGQIHGVLGRNGAGKTTLFNILYSRLHASEGTCTWQGNSLTFEHIAFQETRSYFYPYLTGREYLQLLTQSNPDFAIDQWNRVFNLPLDRFVEDYSTGMKKKLAFLGTLAMDRPIMLLDEPFNGVDVESNEKIFQILMRLRDKGKLIILSSHIIHSLTGTADQIHYLQGGKIQETYLPASFPQLEDQLKEWIRQEIQEDLETLLK